MSNPVQTHYQSYPYPRYPLIASVRRCDTYALNLHAIWARFNGIMPPPEAQKILIAGCGTFAPYPWAVANPDVPITALDLSERSLRRARWHCLLHGRRNVDFRCGDLADDAALDGTFGLIDSFGVLHHMEDPLAGLKALERRLVPGGILRIMLYSRYARREEESIRRAFRMLGIDSPHAARGLLRRAAADSGGGEKSDNRGDVGVSCYGLFECRGEDSFRGEAEVAAAGYDDVGADRAVRADQDGLGRRGTDIHTCV